MKTIQLTKIIGITSLFLVASVKSLNEFTKSFKANFLKICLLFVSLLVFPFIGFAQENGGPYTKDANTVLLMHFEDNTENSADVGVNGIVHGSGISYETSIDSHGNCIRLDNSTADKQSWIEVPFYDELNAGDGFAVECWFKINSWGENTDGARQLFRKDGESWVADYDAYIGENLGEGRQGQVNLNCLADEEQDWGADAPIADFLELNKWYHIAMYYSSTLQHICCVIRNENNKEIFASRGYSKTGPENSTGLFRIGFGEASNSYFDGWIDELRISNVYRKYRDDVLKDVDISAFKDSVFIPIDKWLSYGWPFGEFYPIDPETGDVARKNSCGPMMLSRAIHFWEHPRFPSGVIEHDFQGLPWYANYDETEYLWDQIYDFYNSDATEEYYAPAATFTAQVGVASRKTYDNMYCMPKFLKENFHYSKKTRVVFEEEYTKEEWENIIKNELNNGRICMVGGWGHYYIINGYNSKNEFFTDYSMNDYYWNDIKEFDYGDMQDMIIYMEPDWGNKELELGYPQGNEYLQKQTELEIKWSSENIVNILLEYSTDGGKNWQIIKENIDASLGKYSWIIPDLATKEYKVRVSDSEDGNIYRRTEMFNVFDNQQLEFTYPKLNTQLLGGISQPVYWESEGIAAFKLEYSTDGTNWTLISDSIHNSNKIEFEFPEVNTENVILRATDLLNDELTFTSESFSITADESNSYVKIPDENTVLLMHFEENLNNAATTSFQAYENSMAGTYVENYAHHLGKAFQFYNSETTNHSLFVPHDNELNLDGSWTIEMWFKIKSLNAVLINKPSNNGENYNIHVEAPDGHMEARFYDTNGNRYQIGTPSATIQTNNLYHVTFSNDSSLNSLELTIRNEDFNVIFNETLSYPAGTIPSTSDTDLTIGNMVDGYIDELRISTTTYQSDYIELPFSDDFSNNYENWTTVSVSGDDQWHLSGDDGIDGSKCARFYVTANPLEANDDYLISKVFNNSENENIAITFKYLYHGDGIIPEFYYSSSFDGNLANSTWTKIDNSFWQNMGSWNDARIEIESPGETFVFAIRYQSTNENSNYILIDNFKVNSYIPVIPIVYEKFGESEHFEFYATSEQANYWDTISTSVDNWFKELRSYWDRPLTDPLFSENEKVKIYLTDKNQLDEQIGIISPDWKYGGYKLPDEIYVAIPPGGDNDIYEDSFELLVKNIFSQLALKRRHGIYLTDNYSEAFGLYQSGYRPNRDSIILAINRLGRLPLISDIENTAGINNTFKKDLLVSHIEASVLMNSYQGLGFGNDILWQDHIKYYYQLENENRIGLGKSSQNFDIYCIPRDTVYLDTMVQQLENLFIQYTSQLELNIYHRFNVVIFPNLETAIDMNGGVYSIGSTPGGDNFNRLSPHTAENPMESAAGGLNAHEFAHVIHFNMRPYNGFPNGYFIMEGFADYLREGTIDMRYIHDLWKIEAVFCDYFLNNGTEPTLEFIMSNPQIVEPYLFGQLFYNYLIPDVASYIDVKNFFLGRCDWSAFNKSYEEIDRGYIHYIKSLVNFVPPDSLTSIPFDEPFNDFFSGWTKPNFNNLDNWQINDGGLDGDNCARFYTSSDKNEPIESWLITPPLNAKNMEQINFSFDFARYGEGIELEVFYTNSFDGYTDSTNWTSVKSITMPTDWGWSNSGEITISNPTDTIFIGLRKKSTGERHLQLYIDNFKVDGQITSSIQTELSENEFTIYPNPLTNTSIISFTNSTSGKVNLSIFDLQGRKICTVRNKNMPQGKHTVSLRNQIKENGIYFCTLTTETDKKTLKLIVNK